MKSASGRSAIGVVLLAREVGTVELQQEARVHDRLVLDAQRRAERAEKLLFVAVVLILHDRRHHPGRGRGEEWLDERIAGRIERGAEIAALGLHVAGVRIADVADCLRQPANVVDGFFLQRSLVGLLHEDRITLDVGALAPLPRAAEPRQPVANVKEERVALLLAVVADVDAGFDLLCDDRLHGGASRRLQRRSIDRLAARTAARRAASAPADAAGCRCVL